MASTDTSNGMFYKFYDGSSWSPDWRPINPTGSMGSIDQLVDAGGAEVIVSHILSIDVDAQRAAGIWTHVVPGCEEDVWPRLAIGDSFFVHVIATEGKGELGYHRSPDAGASWSCDDFLLTHPGTVVEADGYDITAKSDKVAIVVAGAGGDVVIIESQDNGDTWTERVIHDIDETGMTAGDEPPDGSCSVVYDSEGNLHASWGSFLYDESGHYRESVDAGIRHWSEATGVKEVAWPVDDTTIVNPGGRNGNLASQPDLCVDEDHRIFIVFSRFINEQDINGNHYEHVFAVGSMSWGIEWEGEFDLTHGTGFDAAFPSVADLVDDYIHFTYTIDSLAGNSVRGIHPAIPVTYRYHVLDKFSVFPVTVDEIDILPGRASLGQNYPNPFNPSTTIRFELPRSGEVSLTIFNLLGQEVTTLVSGHRAAGTHTIRWDAAGHPSGIYFYRMQAGDPSARSGQRFVETKKLVLVK